MRSKKLVKYLLLLSLFTAFYLLQTASISHAWEGRVVNVADGDTVTVLNSQNQTTKIRLYGIDTPEKNQAYGQKAKEFTLSMVKDQIVDIEPIDIDRYGRTVGIVKIGGTTLNEELLKSGFAWLYDYYCHKNFCGAWKQLEQQAKVSQIGLWADPHAQAPWDFRHGEKNSDTGKSLKRDSVSTPAQSNQSIGISGSYHGNVRSYKFHRSGCQHYNCKNCTAVFNSREEALNSGYSPCGICRP